MISVYRIKPAFQRLLSPLLRTLHGAGVTPNAITHTALFLSLAVGVFTWLFPSRAGLLVLPAFLLLRMALNALDGMMARNYSLQSRAGEVWNELGDVLSDLFLYLPLYLLFRLDLALISGFVLLSVVNEFAGLLGKATGGPRRYEGPMGKSDRALLVGAYSLFIFFTGSTSHSNIVFAIANILLVISTSVRVYKTIKQAP